MAYESFIARRYLLSSRYFTSVSTWFTIFGVILGVAVVCFVMSMHNGFETEIRSRLLGTTSHISIFQHQGGFIEDYEELIVELEKIENVIAASPFIYYKAAISSPSAGDGIIVRGVNLEMEAKSSNIERDISVGDFTFDPVINGLDTIQGMIIGDNLAEQLGVFLGQTVVLYSLRGEDLQRNSRPRVAKFYISGIFKTGMHEFDSQMAYISLESAQNLFRTGHAVTAVHLKLENIYLAEEMTPIIDSILGFRYDVVPWYILHRNLFSWISIEKKILFLGFILIVLVAAFSIISTLVMLTMQKRTEIGILKAMGATRESIRRIFITKGLVIAGLGVIGGWGISLTASFLQNRYEIISLPPDIYFISYLPIETHIFDYFLAGVITVIICFFAAWYPAHKASKMSVIEILRQ